MTSDERESRALRVARAGDVEAIGSLLESYRDRLARMVAVRMDARLRGRFDASDVLQEAFVEASERLPSYLDEGERERMPFFLWVRFLVGQKLLQFHRRHLGVQARAADREIPLVSQSTPAASAVVVASLWLAESATPSQAVAAEEEQARVQTALESMAEIDREVLVLRHFEELTNAEVAAVLDLSPQTASARYIRALTRLQAAVGGGS